MTKAYATHQPPFETKELRDGLQQFLDRTVHDSFLQTGIKIGDYKFGVYAFFDYDDEPIYVGQTYERLRTRIRRHLTNQRTDAVAMNVLDPFEVYKIKVWPLPQFQESKSKDTTARNTLNGLEFQIYDKLRHASKFRAVLNEKEPSFSGISVDVPPELEGLVVSEEVFKLRSHPDVRIARRALVLSRLAQVIGERKVKPGLRRTLLVQAQRLKWMAEQRYEELVGTQYADSEEDEDEEEDTE